MSGAAAAPVRGPGTPPQLAFACCGQGIEKTQALFASRDVFRDLKALHAEVGLGVPDFSPQRAEFVRQLNRDGIPVAACLTLSKEDGYYMNAGNEAAARRRIADFEKWTDSQGLKWAAIGLDIEPNFAQLAALRRHPWSLIATLLRRTLSIARFRRAGRAYSQLVGEMQGKGYTVQVYRMPYVPAERSAHAEWLDRMLETVDVRGNEDYVMLYTSYGRPSGAGVIWLLGRHAQGIVVGVTDGAGSAGKGTGPLDWDEFSRDLIVASHFTRRIGVFDLEGCIRQGFLPRLLHFDWGQTVIIPAKSMSRAQRLVFIVRAALWTGSYILYFVPAILMLVAWVVLRRRIPGAGRTRRRESQPTEGR